MIASMVLTGFDEEYSGFHHTPGGTLLEGLGHRYIVRCHRSGQIEDVILLPGHLHQFLAGRESDLHLASKLTGSLLFSAGRQGNAEDCSQNQDNSFHIK